MIATQPQTQLLTYEDYIAEGEIYRRYDIIDGVRIYMTNPTIKHQRLLMRLSQLFTLYENESQMGMTIIAPCDLLISRKPLRTRQPDLLFISFDRLGKRNFDDPAPLSSAPELAVEILSPSDTPRTLRDKILDYCLMGVNECWIVSPQAETVEVLKLSNEGYDIAEIYGFEQTLISLILPDLSIPIASIFGDV